MAEGSIDVIASCGVFLEGHCGPRAFGNLLRYLKEGGVPGGGVAQVYVY